VARVSEPALLGLEAQRLASGNTAAAEGAPRNQGDHLVLAGADQPDDLEAFLMEQRGRSKLQVFDTAAWMMVPGLMSGSCGQRNMAALTNMSNVHQSRDQQGAETAKALRLVLAPGAPE
jgi:hypothetical protein